MTAASQARPATWKLVLAFATVYTAWGTTYLAIRVGVHTLPPALFGGVRVTTASVLLFAWLAWRGEKLSLPLREFLGNALVGIVLFVGGNGLITFGETKVPSGMASILVATTPIWIALIEMCLPRGARLGLTGWLGLFLGLGGVVVVLAPKIEAPRQLLKDFGPLLVLGSSACWSVGSVLGRYQKRTASHLVGAAIQMFIGGATMSIIGLLIGEAKQLSPSCFTPAAVYAFFHLLIVGSMLGFLSYNWLLKQVSAASAGTYAFVNPVVAVFAGWIIAAETPTIGLWLGLVVILAGVALVRFGGRQGSIASTEEIQAARPELAQAEVARPLMSSSSRA